MRIIKISNNIKKPEYLIWHWNGISIKKYFGGGQEKKIDATIITEYQQLLAALQKSEETLLDKNQEEIRNLILMKSSNDTNIKRVCINII
jgi:hypothetical protein